MGTLSWQVSWQVRVSSAFVSRAANAISLPLFIKTIGVDADLIGDTFCLHEVHYLFFG